MDLIEYRDAELQRVLQLGLDGITLLPGEARKLAVAYQTLASRQRLNTCFFIAAVCVAVAQAVVITALL